MGVLLQDLRYGVRVLRKSPGVSLIAIFTLALGISATTAIFSVVYGVLLRPLPYDNPDQIVRVWEHTAEGHNSNLADLNFLDLRAQNHSLQAFAKFNDESESVAGGTEAKRLVVASVSADFFPIMRVSPMIGRGFAPEEQKVRASPVVLVSYSYWKQYLNSAQDLSAVKLRVGDESVSVVGVLPPAFRFPDDADVWIPRELSPIL